MFRQIVVVCFAICGSFCGVLHGFDGGFFDTYRYASSTHDGCRMDVVERGKEYVIEVDVPGAKKSDIDLSYSDNMLVISFSSNEQHEEEDANYLHRERSASAFNRTLRLNDAKFEKAKATLIDGVLTIRVPREKPSENYKKIKID